MSRSRVWWALVPVLAVLTAGTASVAVSSAHAGSARTGHKHRHKHHKRKHHKPSAPKPAQLSGCEARVSASGAAPESSTYAYQVILACTEGEYGSFQVTTDRAIVAGSVTAQLGALKYSCQQVSSTSFSCSGISAAIPAGEEVAVRAFFQSTQPACVNGALESATVTADGKAYQATVGEAGESSC